MISITEFVFEETNSGGTFIPRNFFKLKSKLIKYFNPKFLNSRIDKIRDKLENAGVDTKKIIEIGERWGKRALVEIKSQGIQSITNPKKVTIPFFKKALDEIKENPNLVKIRTDDPSSAQKWMHSIGVLIIILLLNTYLGVILVAVCTMAVGSTGAIIGIALLAIFIAPLTEESGKFFSILNRSEKEFLIVLNGFELLHYVGGMVAVGVSLPTALLLRLGPVLMHIATTYIQKYFIKRGEKTKNIASANTGLTIGIIIHGIFNFFSMLSTNITVINSNV